MNKGKKDGAGSEVSPPFNNGQTDKSEIIINAASLSLTVLFLSVPPVLPGGLSFTDKHLTRGAFYKVTYLRLFQRRAAAP